MSLQIYIPFNGDAKNYGLLPVTTSITGNITFKDGIKYAKCGDLTNYAYIDILNAYEPITHWNDWSVAVWIYPVSKDGHSNTIINSGNWNDQSTLWHFALRDYDSTNKIFTSVLIPNSNSWEYAKITGLSIPINQWTHIVLTYNFVTKIQKLYINNNLAGTYSASDGTTHNKNTSQYPHLRLGANNYATAMYSYSRMSDFRMYDHELSLSEINDLIEEKKYKQLLIWLPLNGHINNQGILSNSVTVDGEVPILTNYGKIGKTYQFTGSSSFEISGFDFSGSQPWSICIWHKIINNGQNYYPIFWLAPSNNDIGGLCPHGTNGGRIEGGTATNKIDKTVHNYLENGTWCHEMFIYNGTDIKVYRNNILVTTIPYTWLSSYHLTHLYIGRFWSSDKFSGNIQDVRLYNYELTENERKKIYQTRILHYPLNQRGNPNLIPQTASTLYGLGYYKKYQTGTVSMSDEQMYDGHMTMKIQPGSDSISTGASTSSTGWLCTLKKDVTYCYSCMIYSTIADTFDFSSLGHMQVWNPNSPDADKSHNDVRQIGQNIIPANTWTHVWYTFTPTMEDCKFGSYFIYFANTSQTIYVTNIKLEEGSSPTPWIPHVDDILMNWQKEYDGAGYCYAASSEINRKMNLSSPRYASCSHFTDLKEALYLSNWNLQTDYYTVSFWAKQSKIKGAIIGGLANSTTSGGGWYKYGGYSWRWLTSVAGGERYYNGVAGDDTLNVWHHFAFVSNRDTLWIYRDGQLIDSVTKATIASIDGYTNWQHLSIGSGISTSDTYFDDNSFASDLQIYASPLSASEVLNLYKLGKL